MSTLASANIIVATLEWSNDICSINWTYFSKVFEGMGLIV